MSNSVMEQRSRVIADDHSLCNKDVPENNDNIINESWVNDTVVIDKNDVQLCNDACNDVCNDVCNNVCNNTDAEVYRDGDSDIEEDDSDIEEDDGDIEEDDDDIEEDDGDGDIEEDDDDIEEDDGEVYNVEDIFVIYVDDDTRCYVDTEKRAKEVITEFVADFINEFSDSTNIVYAEKCNNEINIYRRYLYYVISYSEFLSKVRYERVSYYD